MFVHLEILSFETMMKKRINIKLDTIGLTEIIIIQTKRVHKISGQTASKLKCKIPLRDIISYIHSA